MTLYPPDIVAAAVAYLTEAVPDASTGVEWPAGTDWQATDALLIRVQVAGGGIRSLVLAEPTLVVEARASTDTAVNDLASRVCGSLNAWHGRWADVVIYGCVCSLPNAVPDPDSNLPRSVMTATATARMAGA